MIRRSAGGRGGARGGRREAVDGPEAIAPLLGRVFRELRIEERSREGELAAAWAAAAGAELASRARPVAFRAGRLTVEVDGAPLLQEVRGFRAEALLRALRGTPGGERVAEIRFVQAGRAEGRR